MSLLVIALIILALMFVQGIGLYLIAKRQAAVNEQLAPKEDSTTPLLMQRLEGLERSLDNRMAESIRRTDDQSEKSNRLIREITEELTSMKEIGRQTQGFAEQLQNLEKVLKHQKQRGNLGEASLELVLSNILPPGAYEMQYQFADGKTVDAVIHTNEGKLPVDAKFSLDNYLRIVDAVDDRQREELEKAFKNDLKLRIDETAEYVRPKEGTLPFAFMFIPAEGIFYDLLVNEVGAIKVNTRNLIEYAQRDKKVIIVSPTTFYAYLAMVAKSLDAHKIGENAKEIEKNVAQLSNHLKAYEDFYKRLGNSLSTTVNHYNAGYKELNKVDKDVYRITGEKVGVEMELLDKPGTVEFD